MAISGRVIAASSRLILCRLLHESPAFLQRIPKPMVMDSKLKRIVNDLYRPRAKIGNGSTADAIRHEQKTGKAVGGRFHFQKGELYQRALSNWLALSDGASTADIDAAQKLLQDLNDAMGDKGGKGYSMR